MKNSYLFKSISVITATTIIVAVAFASCSSMKNEYTGKTYSSISDIAKEAREKLEDKYGMDEYDLTVLESTDDSSGGFFGTGKGIPLVKMSLKDKNGKVFNAYYNAGTENPTVYDDYQYDEIVEDYKQENSDTLGDADNVAIRYNVLGYEKNNLLSENELYKGDLSLIDLVGVRAEYIDRDISNFEMNGVDNYLFISYESIEDMERLGNDRVNDWFSIPLFNVMGINAMKDEDSYVEYSTYEYGDYIFVTTFPIEVTSSDEEFDISQVAGHGSINPEAFTDSITVIAEDKYSVFIKSDVVFDKLDELGYSNYKDELENSDSKSQKSKYINQTNEPPVYLGYKYIYKDKYSYYQSQAKYFSGYFEVHNVKPEWNTMRFYVDKEFLRK